ncbi:hypothetical protein FACS1894145_6610 [Bacteroidia bacterium]|nr:hypothetical protein FACS1894145_6610 [Bacteroidia bacterium]
MKAKITFKSLLVISYLLLTFNLQAITIHVETAGTLPTLIDESQKYEITELTLTGDLNGTDIRYIREMAGNTSYGDETDGQLAILNLAGANIVSGGSRYHSSFITSNNTIGEFFFSRCKSLTSVILPNSVTSIGTAAFEYCFRLTSVVIPESITSIESGTFVKCESLTSIVLPNSLTTIGEYAFYACSGLTSIDIPNSVISIEIFAFYECLSLASVTIGNSVTSIEHGTFSDCTSLSSIDIPNSITSIGKFAFSFCTALTSIDIPNSVTSIDELAFNFCTALTSIVIPSSMISIGSWAFNACYGLKEIYSKNPVPPSIGTVAYNMFSTCILYVPKGSYEAYKTADVWKNFITIIEENDETSIHPISKEHISIYSIPNGIAVKTEGRAPVSVYNISGQQVYQSTIDRNAEINLNKGIYIVIANNESKKVIVK